MLADFRRLPRAMGGRPRSGSEIPNREPKSLVRRQRRSLELGVLIEKRCRPKLRRRQRVVAGASTLSVAEHVASTIAAATPNVRILATFHEPTPLRSPWDATRCVWLPTARRDAATTESVLRSVERDATANAATVGCWIPTITRRIRAAVSPGRSREFAAIDFSATRWRQRC